MPKFVRWFIWEAYYAAGGAPRNSNTSQGIDECWSQGVSSGDSDLSKFKAPELEQSYDISRSTASFYGELREFEAYLESERWSHNPDD